MAVRAKFRCHSVTTFATSPHVEAAKQYEFSAVGDDGIPENQRYHKYTPTGSLKIHVDNPAVSFEPGKSYYLDFTLAEES